MARPRITVPLGLAQHQQGEPIPRTVCALIRNQKHHAAASNPLPLRQSQGLVALRSL